MRWRAWLIRVVTILMLTILPVGTAIAGSVTDLVLFATPLFTSGITTFTITYISETQLDFDWTVGDNVSSVMIRGKYSVYPDDIPNINTAPSDGYLVYSGNATHANDTSMDFDTNPGPIYYRAWAQKTDGTWVITPQQGWKESEIMTLIAFFIFAGILSFIGSKSSYWILKFLAGLSWWALAAYWQSSPPSSIVKGSPTDTIVTMLLFVVGLAFMIMTFWYTKTEEGQEVGRGFRLPFQKPPEPAAPIQTRNDRTRAYANRVNRALRNDR